MTTISLRLALAWAGMSGPPASFDVARPGSPLTLRS